MSPAWWWSWLLDGGFLLTQFVVGRKKAWGWLVSAITGVAWLVYATVTSQWGFFPGTALGIVIAIKNYRDWSRGVVETRLPVAHESRV